MLNNVAIIGRLVADPELRYSPNGVAVNNMTIAVNRARKNAQGERDTDFFDVVCFQKTAELAAQYLAKGRQVGISGRLQQERWETNEGKRRSKVVIIAEQLEFLGGKQQQSETAETNAFDKFMDGAKEVADDDVPF